MTGRSSPAALPPAVLHAPVHALAGRHAGHLLAALAQRCGRAAREAWQEASRRVVLQLVAKGPFRSRLSNESFLSAFEERLEEKRPWCYPCLGRRRLETRPRGKEASLLSLATGAGLALLSPAERKALHRRKSEAGMNRLSPKARATAHAAPRVREAQAAYEAVLERHWVARERAKRERWDAVRARRKRRRRVCLRADSELEFDVVASMASS